MVEQYKRLGIIIDEHFEHNTQVRKNRKDGCSTLKILRKSYKVCFRPATFLKSDSNTGVFL